MISRRINPAVFLKAAELIDNGRQRFACHALDFATYGGAPSFITIPKRYGSPAQAAFVGIYHADSRALALRNDGVAFSEGDAFFSGWAWQGRRAAAPNPNEESDDSDHRVFALLLCYEIARRAKFARKRQFRLLKEGEILRERDEFRSGDGWGKTVFPGDTVESWNVGKYRRQVRAKKGGRR